jgi:hypothetical protein
MLQINKQMEGDTCLPTFIVRTVVPMYVYKFVVYMDSYVQRWPWIGLVRFAKKKIIVLIHELTISYLQLGTLL